MRTLSRLRRAATGPPGRSLVKLVAYAAACLVVLAALVSLIGNRPLFRDTTGYQAVLPDATGLFVNDAVKVAGVRVGRVTGIEVERGRAVVSFALERDLALRTTTRTGLRWRNVLGQKYLYLYPGTGGGTLQEGDRLPAGNAVGSAEVGELLNAVAPVLRAIDPTQANRFITTLNDALAGNEERVRDLLGSSATLSRDLGAADDQVGSLIENLDTVVGTVAERDDDIEDIITRVGSASQALADRKGDIDALVVNLLDVQDALNRLLEARQGDLDATVGDLDTVTGVLRAHRDDLEAGLATLPSGLAPYHQISAYGQWFNVRARVLCLANQSTCVRESASTDLLSGPARGAGSGTTLLDSVFGFAAGGGPVP